MKQELIEQIKQIIGNDITIDFTLEDGVRPDRIEPETVWITEHALCRETSLATHYQMAVKIKELLLNNGYVLDDEKISTYPDHDDILNLRFKSKEIISKRQY